MPKQVHRQGDSRLCGATTTVVGQSTVYVENQLISVEGDTNTHEGGAFNTPAGFNEVYVNNKPIIRIEDPAGADTFHPAPPTDATSSGASTVYAGFPIERNVGTAESPVVAFELESQPAGEAPVGADAAEIASATQMSNNTPGGGAIAPRVDGGPFTDSGNTAGAGSSFVPGPPGDCTRPELGKVSERYESNGDSAAIGNDSTGGYSYGTYQIATKTGTFANWMSYLQALYPAIYTVLSDAGGTSAATAGTDSFKAAFKGLKSNPDFVKCQHDFIQATHYDKLVAKIKAATGLDVCDGSHSNGLQDAVWSISVQHGPGSKIPERAWAGLGDLTAVSETALINALYDERQPSKYFGKSTAAVQASVGTRFSTERTDCLASV